MAALAALYPELPGAFVAEAEAVARRLGIEPPHLMAVMDFETGGSFDPATVNPRSGATGLIQFMPATAAELGTTTAALRQMTALQQLAFVEEYFAMRIRQRGPLRSLEDVYMAVLYPAAIGKGSEHRLFSLPSTAYAQNDYLDLDGDGHVTVAEAASHVRRRLRGNPLTDPIVPPIAPVLAGAAIDLGSLYGGGLNLPWWTVPGSPDRGARRSGVAGWLALGLGAAGLAWFAADLGGNTR